MSTKKINQVKSQPTLTTVKSAQICYKKLPCDKILITGFWNILTAYEIRLAYGKQIADIYFRGEDCIKKVYCQDGNEAIEVYQSNIDYCTIRIGSVYKKKMFEEIVMQVKKCGNILHEIIEAVNGGEEKTINI
jgi:hypothetical protein